MPSSLRPFQESNNESFSLAKSADHPETDAENSDVEDKSKSEDRLSEAISRLGTNAKTRYLTAKLRVLEKDNTSLQNDLRVANTDIDKLSNQIQELSQEKSKLQRQTGHSSTNLEKLRAEYDSLKEFSNNLALERAALQKQLDTERREHEKTKSESHSLDSRLHRTLEDVQKLRRDLEKSRSDLEDTKHQLNLIDNDNRRLERQKAQLVAAFKKQMKLIDILRRQKMLIEASRALKMTEDEFLKTLDLQMVALVTAPLLTHASVLAISYKSSTENAESINCPIFPFFACLSETGLYPVSIEAFLFPPNSYAFLLSYLIHFRLSNAHWSNLILDLLTQERLLYPLALGTFLVRGELSKPSKAGLIILNHIYRPTAGISPPTLSAVSRNFLFVLTKALHSVVFLTSLETTFSAFQLLYFLAHHALSSTSSA
ncbi:hypothetical protein ACTXT7_002746 [Hymenolepis weldensis]